jgi:hypothetical protein
MGKNIYIDFADAIMGLGNNLFQIATAIYYSEKYNYRINLIRCENILYGTSNKFGKIKCFKDDANNFLTYDKTIFNKLTFLGDVNISNSYQFLKNDYTSDKIVPNCESLIIRGYNQNIDLFKEYIDKIPLYLDLNYSTINSDIIKKYGDVSNSICLGVRIGEDFKHMKNITQDSYLKALDYYKEKNINTDVVYIISDTPIIGNSKYDFEFIKKYNCVEVNESDIVQFYFGLMCKNYILSESTFHLWIAYLGTIKREDKNVICFNNTDITNRNLCLENWIRLDC